MLTSLALIFLLGMLLGWLLRQCGLPGLLGFLIAGMLLGPGGMNLLDAGLLLISADLRRLALIIILLRAGLSLDLGALRRAGRSAVLMCFVPACFELAGVLLLAPPLLGVSLLDAAIIGTVLAAVSPAVIVPRMLKLMEEGYGTGKGIPQLVLAGASVDDVFVIVLFTAFTGLAGGETVQAAAFVQIPVAILLGIAGGALVGLLLSRLFKRVHMRDSAKVVILLSMAFLLMALEELLGGRPGFSGLLAVVAMGAALLRLHSPVAGRLAAKFSQLWVAAEVLLFVLVGASVDISYALAAGGRALLLVLGGLAFRMAGVLVSTLKSGLNLKERLFCMLAYIPKATVQAAIGAVPLSMGLASGPLVLTVAVLAILVTAPLGALGIDATYKRLLTKE